MPDSLPLQTRDVWDCQKVDAFLRAGTATEQGWVSLVDEANHRIARLENAFKALAQDLESQSRHASDMRRHLNI